MLTFGSVCSGIGAPECAWQPLGWRPAFLSETDAFPRAVLAHRFPGVPVHGDFTTIKAGQYDAIDLLVGGTPCQSFSVAGLRKGLADERGNLALEYLRLADRLRPRWLVWENVPGVLSSSGGRDFGAFLGGLGELGYGFAYRVLDAQYAGVPQRRRRVFVVGYLGDWRRAAAVLFEPHSMQGHPAPRREAGEKVAVCPTLRVGGNRTGGDRPPGTDVDTCESLIVARCVTTGESKRQDAETCTLVPVSFPWMAGGTQRMPHKVNLCGALIKSQTHAVAVGLAQITSATNRTRAEPGLPSSTLMKGSAMHAALASGVRRLTPRECERLQGFPDDWTLIPYRRGIAADGPRYKAIGNSMAVPVVRWIGERIARVEAGQA